jgi:peptidoglycan/LPS O-acetylase OafA/YrhL
MRAVLGLFGIYGVSIFFVLSGYCLAHVYEQTFTSSVNASQFSAYLRRRIGRIAPLFILVIVATTVGRSLISMGSLPPPFLLLTNSTLLFGFINPASTPVVGGWTIGVEVVFYLLFPFVMLMRHRPFQMIGISFLLTLFVSHDVSLHGSLPEAWN